MHCPNCRHDNAATTRFCTSCGAVLVESTPDGRRRRVLRPWGLLQSAPLTESPAMPEIVAAVRASGRTVSPRRLDIRFTVGAAVVTIAGMLLYPYARALDGPQFGDSDAAAGPMIVVTAPIIAEAIIVAPPLVESLPVGAKLTAPTQAAMTTPPREARPREALAPSSLQPTAQVVPETPPREPVAGHGRTTAPSPPRAPPSDRWQPLRDALGGCGMRDGLIERAVCEQGARLAHCDGYWGIVALCPAGRTDYGQ